MRASVGARAERLLRTGYESAVDPGGRQVRAGPVPVVRRATCYGKSASGMVSWILSFSNQYHARTGRWPVIYTATS